MRISNFTQRNGPSAEDHCVRADQFNFMVTGGGEEKRVSGGELSQWCLTPGCLPSGVLLCDINVTSTKTARTSQAPTFKKIARRSLAEGAFLDDIVSWIRGSRVLGADEITTRYAVVRDGRRGTRRVVGRKEVANAIKEAHELEGLPPGKFSCKSLRAGFSTHADYAGMPAAIRNQRAGWAIGSRVPDTSYSVNLDDQGLMAFAPPAGEASGYGIGSLRRMLPASLSDVPLIEGRSNVRGLTGALDRTVSRR